MLNQPEFDLKSGENQAGENSKPDSYLNSGEHQVLQNLIYT